MAPMLEEWRRAGFVRFTPGDVVDHREVEAQVLRDCETFKLLAKTAAQAASTAPEEKYASRSLRFGRLNLILPSTRAEFAAWRHATDTLRLIRPVPREVAVDVIKTELAEARECDEGAK